LILINLYIIYNILIYKNNIFTNIKLTSFLAFIINLFGNRDKITNVLITINLNIILELKRLLY